MMTITEANCVTVVLRALQGQLPDYLPTVDDQLDHVVEAAQVLAERASKPLQLKLTSDVDPARIRAQLAQATR